MGRKPSTLLFLLLLGIVGLTACGGEGATWDGTLRFTAIPDENTTELALKYRAVAEYLSEELGIPVEYVPTVKYEASVEAFKNGDIQLAWFGGLTGVQARAAVEGSRAIAQGTIDPRFKSYFIAHESTGLELGDAFPQQLAGRSFTFGSDSSTSGRLMPEHFIRQNTGKSPEEFFERPNHYAGSHDKTAELVAAGTFEAGALNYATYDRMVRNGTIDAEKCRIIWVTPEYPDYNWTAHPILDAERPGLIDRVQQALLELKDESLLVSMDRPEGFIRATNADFEPILTLARELGFLR